MFKKLRKLLTSRILWIGLILILEIALIFVFFYVIADSLREVFNMKPWQMYLTVAVILFAISIGVIVYIVNSQAKPAYKIAWLVVVAIIPLFGAFFYLLFGNKKITSRQKRRMKPILDLLSNVYINKNIEEELEKDNVNAKKIANYIAKASGGDLYKNTNISYYSSGEEAFPEMIKELEKAEKFIFIEYFVISPGLFWDSILKVLINKVKQGVDVRLIYDDVGSAGYLPSKYDKKLNELGIKTFAYQKFKPLLDVKINNRDHRKIMVIDGKVAFTGGINIADEYINKKKLFGYWKDNAIKVKGPAVYGYTMEFLTLWLYLTEVDLSQVNLNDENYLEYFPDMSNHKGSGYVQPYTDLLYNSESVGERVYLQLINYATKYLYITTPYLIIDDELVNALCSAAKQGIDVRIITPRIPDKKTVFRITRSHYRTLLLNGVKIYEYLPGFIHMKMFVVDDVFATVGTINLDYRSLYLHLENATFMYKTDCIVDMKKDFLNCIKVSEEIKYSDYKKYAAPRRLYWAILRLFAPLF